MIVEHLIVHADNRGLTPRTLGVPAFIVAVRVSAGARQRMRHGADRRGVRADPQLGGTVRTARPRPQKRRTGVLQSNACSTTASGSREVLLTDTKEPLVGEDLVLLLLRAQGQGAASRDRVNGITRLEKLLFLADQESELPRAVEGPIVFKPYNYGPYSKQVYEAVEVLEEAGLVREERYIDGRSLDVMEELSADAAEIEGLERRFFLTDDGRDVADLLAGQHPEYAKLLSDIKQRYGDLPLRRLIQYVYSRYPKYAEESLIRDKIL